MIDRLTVDRILDTANIVDVVSDFVTLKRSGANLKGLCPFHDDRTPSFMVSPAKNICKCFACGVGGRPVDFIMKHEQLSYYDALRYLAKKYGIEIQERELTDEEKQSQTDRDSMFILNDWAKDWFQNQLNNSPMGRAVGWHISTTEASATISSHASNWDSAPTSPTNPWHRTPSRQDIRKST